MLCVQQNSQLFCCASMLQHLPQVGLTAVDVVTMHGYIIPILIKIIMVVSDFLRWMHRECSSSEEFSEAKVICLRCKEDHQQPVAQSAKLQTEEEVTIQAKTDTFTENPADFSEVTSEQKGTLKLDLAHNKPEKETLMDLGMLRAKLTINSRFVFCWNIVIILVSKII